LLHHPVFPTLRLQHIWKKIPGAFFAEKFRYEIGS